MDRRMDHEGWGKRRGRDDQERGARVRKTKKGESREREQERVHLAKMARHVGMRKKLGEGVSFGLDRDPGLF